MSAGKKNRISLKIVLAVRLMAGGVPGVQRNQLTDGSAAVCHVCTEMCQRPSANERCPPLPLAKSGPEGSLSRPVEACTDRWRENGDPLPVELALYCNRWDSSGENNVYRA